MKRSLLILTALVAFAMSAMAQTTWTIDKAHTKVGFSVVHMVVSETVGNFKDFDGTLTASKADFSDAVIDVTIKTTSISTDNDYRDNHLRSDDFFGSEKFPTATFKSKKMEKVADKKYKVTGDLTIKGVTKSVVLDATLGGVITLPNGDQKAGFKATTVINRFDFGLNWNKMIEAGSVVDKDVTIALNVEFDNKVKKRNYGY